MVMKYGSSMAQESLKNWFDKARVAVLDHPQRADYILPRLALTMVCPRHQDAFIKSCHASVAQFLRLDRAQKHAMSDDRIIMVGPAGNADEVSHTIVIDRNGKVRHDSLSPKLGYGYDRIEKSYFSQDIDEPLAIIRDISYGDFVRDYVQKITINASASKPRQP